MLQLRQGCRHGRFSHNFVSKRLTAYTLHRKGWDKVLRLTAYTLHRKGWDKVLRLTAYTLHRKGWDKVLR
ncbi:MAG: hypothetical protein IJY30_02330, partial [Muribaculaceae bacterium]|nr:hypothetical protein [Muribaculaceae bacterium]